MRTTPSTPLVEEPKNCEEQPTAWLIEAAVPPVVFPSQVITLVDCDLYTELPISQRAQGQEVDAKEDTAPEVPSLVCFR